MVVSVKLKVSPLTVFGGAGGKDGVGSAMSCGSVGGGDGEGGGSDGDRGGDALAGVVLGVGGGEGGGDGRRSDVQRCSSGGAVRKGAGDGAAKRSANPRRSWRSRR